MQQNLTALRKVAKRDHAVLASLRKDAALQRILLGASEPVTEPVDDWLTRRTASGWIRAIADDSDSCIGYVQLSDFHHKNRTAWFGICVTPDARGLGHGQDATQQTLAIARAELNLRKVSLKVRADNPALRLYDRQGFRRVGVQCEEYDDGTMLHDVIIMEYLFSGSSAT